MILFQAQIEEHQSLAQHYRELAAKREALAAELLAVQEQADVSLTALKSLLEKCRDASPHAIASLKSAVLNLFPDNGNDGGGNQPDSPTPPDSPDSDEPELLCLNGVTGDYLLGCDEPEKHNPVCPEGEHTLESNAPLVGQVCPLDTGLYWANSTPDGSSWEFASHLCCLLEDAPASCLVGQSYELCSLLEDAPQPFVELVVHSDNPNVAYIKKVSDGQILTAYFGFRTKAIALSWKEFLEAIAHRIEYRKAKQVPGVTWEIKCWGMSMNQIDRLAKNCDFSKAYQPQAPKFESPSSVELGVMPPSDWGKVGKTPILEEGDTAQVLTGKYANQVGTVEQIYRLSEKPIALSLPGGHIKQFYRNEVKLVSKSTGEAQPQKQQLQSGQVLMGDRVVTTGNYIGVARQVRESNALRGTFDKLAAIELVKAGLTPEMALATATGQLDDASDF